MFFWVEVAYPPKSRIKFPIFFGLTISSGRHGCAQAACKARHRFDRTYLGQVRLPAYFFRAGEVPELEVLFSVSLSLSFLSVLTRVHTALYQMFTVSEKTRSPLYPKGILWLGLSWLWVIDSRVPQIVGSAFQGLKVREMFEMQSKRIFTSIIGWLDD
jgi:hypothetical protein